MKRVQAAHQCTCCCLATQAQEGRLRMAMSFGPACVGWAGLHSRAVSCSRPTPLIQCFLCSCSLLRCPVQPGVVLGWRCLLANGRQEGSQHLCHGLRAALCHLHYRGSLAKHRFSRVQDLYKVAARFPFPILLHNVCIHVLPMHRQQQREYVPWRVDHRWPDRAVHCCAEHCCADAAAGPGCRV